MRRLTFRIVTLLLIVCAVFLAGPTVSRADTPTVPTHYYFDRPIAPTGSGKVDRGLPYGWTRWGQSPIHHGVDMENRLNTPVIAAADGVVYYAGDDSSRVFGPHPNFYGKLVVLQHDLKTPEGGSLFTLYGHLNVISVQAGQHVGKGQQIGGVGKTGIAVWYHLHFEVRVNNPDDYNAVRNPELWFAPRPGTGTLIGRMVDADGAPAMGIRYTMSPTRGVYPGWTYADPGIPADPAYNENFTMGDLPAACYMLRVKDNHGGYAFVQQVCIKAGQTVFVNVQLKPFPQ